jgi:ketol-acid reductoisomerase
VAILGFGNQGRAQAHNLRDSGAEVRIVARPGKSARQARREGFPVLPLGSPLQHFQFIAVLLPDCAIPDVLSNHVFPRLEPASAPAFVFAHGYSLIHGAIRFPQRSDVVLVAPLGPGDDLRRRYQEKSGVACWIAIHRNASKQALSRALAYAWGIGSLRAGALRTTVQSEVHTDLFGERAVLVGGLLAIILTGFEVLREAGFPPEASLLETAYQLRSLAELLEEHGPLGMLARVSHTAREGALEQLPYLCHALRRPFASILQDVRRGLPIRKHKPPQGDRLLNGALRDVQAALQQLQALGIIPSSSRS